MNKLIIVITGMFILMTNTGSANTGVFYGAGNQVVPIKNNKIQLVREEVNIRLTVEKNGGQSGLPLIPQANVTATFFFKNTSADSVSLQMGFPFLDLQGFGNEKEVLGRMDFRVINNGRQVPTELKEGLIEKELDPHGLFKKVFAWDDIFGPGETKTVLVTYKLLMSVVSVNSNDRTFDEIGEKYYELDKLFPALSYSFGYITKTAYTWKGPVEEAVFRFDAKELMEEFDKSAVFGESTPDKLPLSRPVYLENIMPSGYERQDSVYKWIFKGKLPEEGLSVNFIVFLLPSKAAEVKQFMGSRISKLEGITKGEYIPVFKQYYTLLVSRGNSADKFTAGYFKGVRFINDKTRFIFDEDKKNVTDILNQFEKLTK
ncbi:MAG: hypothetical protein PHS93_09855 [Candidatus Omnitrophica bacterium]|nr:hypothetical protein [Candidatus Omnitrophota bacterium]MDD5353453.1 hypothetical protein [Candidatus Omnitrophota bacterium]MDD5551449.1 hypothetical protein [Candidatus Omnitrophota bacterium]